TPARPCQALWVTTNPTQHPSIPIKSTKKFPKKKKTPGFLRGFGKDGLRWNLSDRSLELCPFAQLPEKTF
ncbi:MAG: hypothetical protein LWY06_08735, partial [Firmicutes bacterium]|nr:hypothetical protein [Bacillota bacterium]